MCDWQGYVPHPMIHLHQLSKCVSYAHVIQSHTDTHSEKMHAQRHAHSTHTHIHKLIRLMTDECDNCWVFGEIPRKICHLIGGIQRVV